MMDPHDRELAVLGEQMKNEAHARRNMKMVVDAHDAELVELRGEVASLRTTMRTALSVVAVVVAVFAWLIELALRVS